MIFQAEAEYIFPCTFFPLELVARVLCTMRRVFLITMFLYADYINIVEVYLLLQIIVGKYDQRRWRQRQRCNASLYKVYGAANTE